MTRSRHKAATGLPKRLAGWRQHHTSRQRLVPIAVRVAALAVIVTAVVGIPEEDGDSSASSTSAQNASDSATYAARPGSEERPSRSQQRPQLQQKVKESSKAASGAAVADELKVVGKRYATAELNLLPEPGGDVIKVLDIGTKLKVTDNTDGDLAQVVYEGKPRWVTAEYLSKQDPEAQNEGDDSSSEESSGGSSDSSGGISSAPCDSGSDVESGLTENAVAVHRAVCAEFPEVSSYGGVRSDSGEHGTGQALDIMISSSSQGDSIADWVRAHAGELGVSEVIWSQQIWTTQRSSEGWRPMEDRGSATANHMDHVHVTVD